MIKSDLIEKLFRSQPYIDKRVIQRCVELIHGCLIDHLLEGGRAEIRDFGRFELRYRKAGIARNPKTGKIISTDSRALILFKAGKGLKLRINKNLAQIQKKRGKSKQKQG